MRLKIWNFMAPTERIHCGWTSDELVKQDAAPGNQHEYKPTLQLVIDKGVYNVKIFQPHVGIRLFRQALRRLGIEFSLFTKLHS